MKNTKRALVTLVLLATMATAAAGGDAPCEILGMLGMTPVTEASCAAIWLPVPGGAAIAGLRWYNNDDQVVFPRILVASGDAGTPVDPSAAIEVATGVQGPAQGWAEVQFSEPYACGGDGLYCLIMLPADSQYTGEGHGGGPAFGYTADPCGHVGWLGGAEGSWLRLVGSISLAIEPMLVAADPDMVVLKSLQAAPVAPTSGLPVLHGSRPNPFNPQAMLEYSLPRGMPVELVIYDLRGHLVRRLVSGFVDAGQHTVTWQGENEAGRQVASGVYVARFQAGSVVQSHRLLLVK